MADARIDQLADAAKAVIQTAVGDDDTVLVTCEDVPVVGDVEGGFPERVEGKFPAPTRRVFVMAPAYADAGPVTRAEQATYYTIEILVVEQCADAGPMSLEWRRERTAWVQDKIVNTLADARTFLDETAVPDTYSVEQSWEYVGEQKLFWCLVSITYLEHAE